MFMLCSYNEERVLRRPYYLSLDELIKRRDVPAIKAYMAENNLIVRDGKIVPKDEEAVSKLQYLSSFWNQRQQARKILLG